MIARSVTTFFDPKKDAKRKPIQEGGIAGGNNAPRVTQGFNINGFSSIAEEMKEKNDQVDSQKMSERDASENSSITFQSDGNSSNASIMTAAKKIGYKPGKLPNGKHPVTTKRVQRKIKQMRLMQRISHKIQDFILQPENSWIEQLDSKETIEVGDINADMDLFFVVKGAIEFTMREDHI